MTDFRPIERGTFTTIEIPASFGPAPQLQWIAIDKLVVDDTYQRPLESQTSRKNVRTIATDFDWRRFAPVVVSPITGGCYAIVDGQHRTTAALLVGLEQVPCLVIMADRREQARAFEAINGQVTQIRPGQIFKARLTSGDRDAQRIFDVCAAAGVTILFSNRSAQQMAPGETLALLAITRSIEMYGDKTVRIALTAIRENAGTATGYLRGPIVMALATVLGDNPEWRDSVTPLAPFAKPFDFKQALSEAARTVSDHRGTTIQDQLQALLIRHIDRFYAARAA